MSLNNTPVRFRIGTTEKGLSLHLHHDGEVKDLGTLDNMRDGIMVSWTRAAILTTSGADARFRELVPQPGADGRVRHKDLFVTGEFIVHRTINNSRTARAAFRSFKE